MRHETEAEGNAPLYYAAYAYMPYIRGRGNTFQQAKLNEIAAKQAALDEQYAALQAEEQRLEYMIEYAKSDEYRVQYAREKLGLVLPDDIKFDITD